MKPKSESKMRWRLAPPPDETLLRQFPELPEIAVSLLANRNLKTKEDIDGFLSPDYDRGIHDPFLFRHMAAACGRLWTALQRGEPTVIYSDYDADGVTGAVILVSVFRDVARMLGRDPGLISSYIPHREKEGYGLQAEAVGELLRQGMKLLISVDCGISSAPEIALAQAGGCDAIVVDHHQAPATVPDCLTLHPSVPGETYPFKNLAAVGVAFKFACGFVAHCRKQGLTFADKYEKRLLDLVAIATVTDVVPLVGENRVLEHFGLIVLNLTRRPGLKRLISEAGLVPGAIDTGAVGFGLGPRINAASRLDHASIAFNCLMAEDEAVAAKLAAGLNQINQERQRLTEQMAVAAMTEVAANPERPIHILAGENWPAGVVGITAGRLASRTGRPSFVFSQEGEHYVGSGRSIPEFDVMAALDRTKGRLTRFGGHPQACGLTIEGRENFRGFVREMTEYAATVLSGLDLRPVLDLEGVIRPDQVTWETIEWLNKFRPFGEGNRQPRFLMPDLEVSTLACIGKDGQHARIGVRPAEVQAGGVEGGTAARRGYGAMKDMKLIGFGLAEAAVAFPPGSRIDAAVELGVNEWNGRREIQVKLIDLRPSRLTSAGEGELTPVRAAAATASKP